MKEPIKNFQKTVWQYHKKNRRDFPWRETRNPYHILVSEIMLQQTGVVRVISKYKEFLDQFPTIEKLAKAELRDVLHLWQGLGYNRRAKFLFECAKEIYKKYEGEFPKDLNSLKSLPGIGQSTAGAVLNFAFNVPTPFIETNIRTVFIHHFFKDHKTKITEKEILELINTTLDTDKPREWFYALYDYGSFLKSTLDTDPAKQSSIYKKQSSFKGSFREKRSFVLKLLLNNKLRETEIEKHLLDKKLVERKDLKEESKQILASLLKDRLILKDKSHYFV
ncbi:MAG: HhH-GPD family protein [Candidatus Taylorbacteria bacterium]|nr:HhH-GPD family protein [Candidatus Taylorbacteria bacterium]